MGDAAEDLDYRINLFRWIDDKFPRLLVLVPLVQRRLMEPAFEEHECRRLLQRRAFDHLLTVALEHIAEHREERESLTVRRALLRSKLDITRMAPSVPGNLISGITGFSHCSQAVRRKTPAVI